MVSKNGMALARRFHELYERLAPDHGYETRDDTKELDFDSPNGRLMLAVCAEIEQDFEKERHPFEHAVRWIVQDAVYKPPECLADPEVTERWLFVCQRALDGVAIEMARQGQDVRNELERERMRLAAVGTAALGYFEGCCPEYESATLHDVLRLYNRLRDVQAFDLDSFIGSLPAGEVESTYALRQLFEKIQEIARGSQDAESSSMLENRLAQCARAIYLATEEEVARDISRLLLQTIAELKHLRRKVKESR